MTRVALVGAGVSRFGVREATYRDLIWEAGKACFDSVPGLRPKDLDGLVVGSVMPERNRVQAMVPQGAHVFANRNGTAPGPEPQCAQPLRAERACRHRAVQLAGRRLLP